MTKFKRVSLVGSEEIFRPTRLEVEETDEVISEALDRRPVEKLVRTVSFTPEEVTLLLEAIQAAKYPEKMRGKLPLDKFERYDGLRDKLQGTEE
jgi:hypothetical protein